MQRVSEISVLGAIPLCSSCGGGKLNFDLASGKYTCPGYYDDTDFVRCFKKVCYFTVIFFLLSFSTKRLMEIEVVCFYIFCVSRLIFCFFSFPFQKYTEFHSDLNKHGSKTTETHLAT